MANNNICRNACNQFATQLDELFATPAFLHSVCIRLGFTIRVELCDRQVSQTELNGSRCLLTVCHYLLVIIRRVRRGGVRS